MKKYFQPSEIKLNQKQKYKIAALMGTAVIFFLVFWIIGLFKTPANFKTVEPVTDEHISPYLTNYILPELHNKSQYREPFDLTVSQAGINEIIARHIDPNTLARAGLSDLTTCFKEDEILLTAKTDYKGFDFIVTMILEPRIDKKGQLSLDASDFKIGKSPLPFVAEAIKKKILNGLDENLKDAKNDEFVNLLFSSGSVEPVFGINNSKLRIDKITVQDGKLIIHFLPEHNG